MTWRYVLLGLTCLGLGACSIGANDTLVSGSNVQIAQVRAAATGCGVWQKRVDSLDEQNAMLLIGRYNSSTAVACLMRWLTTHELSGATIYGSGPYM